MRKIILDNLDQPDLTSWKSFKSRADVSFERDREREKKFCLGGTASALTGRVPASSRLAPLVASSMIKEGWP